MSRQWLELTDRNYHELNPDTTNEVVRPPLECREPGFEDAPDCLTVFVSRVR